MPQNWWDEDKVEGFKSGDAPNTGDFWNDDLVVKPKKKEPRTIGFGPFKTELSPEKAARFERGERLGRDVGNSVALSAISGPGLMLNMLGQGAYGAGSHLYDKAKEKGISGLNSSDAKGAGVTGAFSMLGPLFGKAISPKAPMMPKNRQEMVAYDIAKSKGIDAVPERLYESIARDRRLDIFKQFVPDLGHSATSGVPKWAEKGADFIARNAIPAAIGGVAGHTMFDSPMLGAMLGIALPHSKDIVSSIPTWAKNSWIHYGTGGPTTQEILNQLTRETGNKVEEYVKH